MGSPLQTLFIFKFHQLHLLISMPLPPTPCSVVPVFFPLMTLHPSSINGNPKSTFEMASEVPFSEPCSWCHSLYGPVYFTFPYCCVDFHDSTLRISVCFHVAVHNLGAVLSALVSLPQRYLFSTEISKSLALPRHTGKTDTEMCRQTHRRTTKYLMAVFMFILRSQGADPVPWLVLTAY